MIERAGKKLLAALQDDDGLPPRELRRMIRIILLIKVGLLLYLGLSPSPYFPAKTCALFVFSIVAKHQR